MRYLQLIFVFVFVFIGLLNVIFRVAASKRKNREQALASGNLPSNKTKDNALLPSETREYSENKVEKINTEPEDGFTETAVSEHDTAGLIPGSDAEKTVLTRDVAAGRSMGPVTGKPPVSSLLETEASPGPKRSEQPAEATWKIGSSTADSVNRPNISVTDQRPGKITAWERSNKLSVLKRAVVLSEVLGPPKSSV